MNEPSNVAIEETTRICILAGGRSSRMGHDKSAIRLGGRTLLQIVTETAGTLGCPVGLIRNDVVASCGPLGGILTGFRRFPETRLLFLSCDMPFVSRALLEALAAQPGGAFVEQDGRVGFPFRIDRRELATVERRHAAEDYSLQGLARALGGSRLRSANPGHELFNINRPEDLEQARVMMSG